MRIGVCFREVVPESGGGYTFETDLVDTLLRRDSDHSFVFLGPAGPVLEKAARAGFKTVPIPSEGPRRWFLRAPRSLHLGRPRHVQSGLDARVRDAGVDLLWNLGPDTPSMEVPYVLTIWDLQHRLQPFFPEVSANGVWAARERYYSSRIRRAALIVSGTAAGRSEIETFYQVPSDRVILCPHPTPRFALGFEEKKTSTILERLGVVRDYVFYPAQFWPHKNHIALLEALKILQQRNIDLQLVLSGSDRGKNQDYVRAAASDLGVADSVVFAGFVNRDELVDLYRGAVAMAYVSFFGPENLPPLEAFALGCPVIAAQVPGAEEQLGSAARLVHPVDYEQLASEIETLLTDQAERRSMIAKGKERARQTTTENFVNRLLAALEPFERVRRTWKLAGQ
jgi:glycosyltransferase involved in cell wall biosynthesis